MAACQQPDLSCGVLDMLSRLVRNVAAIGTTIVVFLAMGCTEESQGLRLAQKIHETIEVDGFEHGYDIKRGSTMRVGYLGPPQNDYLDNIFAPGWDRGPYPAHLPNNDSLFKKIAYGPIHSPQEHYGCSVTVKILRDGASMSSSSQLTPEARDALEEGRKALLLLSVTCLPRADSSNPPLELDRFSGTKVTEPVQSDN